METLILNCDFSNVKDETTNEFRSERTRYKEQLSSLDYVGILSIVKAFQNKVCVRGFPGVRSPGSEYANLILTTILQTIRWKVDENIFPSNKVEERLLDLYVELLKAGPGSGHCELLQLITKHVEFQDLYGDSLQNVTGGFKAISYVEEGNDSIYIDTVKRVYPDQLSTLVIRSDKEDRLRSPEVHRAFMDLFVFYLVQLPHVPDTLQTVLIRAQDKIYQAYHMQPFFGIQDAGFYRSQLLRVADFIKDHKFPQHRQICETTYRKLPNILQIKDGKMIAEVYADICQLLKEISLKRLTGKDTDLLKKLDCFYKEIPIECFKNPQIFETWAATSQEILEKSPHEKITGNELAYTTDRFTDNLKPNANLGKIWLSVIGGFCGWVHEKLMRAAERTLSTNQWKSCWKWKENISIAKAMIKALTNADHSSVENAEDYSSNAESFLEKLLDQLILMKVFNDVEVEVAELAMVTMEAFGKGIAVDRLCRTASEKMSLTNNKHLIKGYLERFLCLLKNEDFDWDGGWITTAGVDFFNNLIKSSGGDEVRDLEMDEAFIQVFLFCLSEDREYISLQRQHLNIFGLVAVAGLPQYTNLHTGKTTIGRLKPLFPHIQRLMDDDDEMIKTVMRTVTRILGEEVTQLMDTQGMENLISLYIKERDLATLDAISSAYQGHSEALASHFLPLLKASTQKTQTNEIVMQTMFLKKVAEKQPELFTKEALELIFKHHFMEKNANPQVLMVLDVVSKSHAENLEPFVESHLMKTDLMMELMAHYQFNILIRIAAKCNDKQSLVYSYLMKRLHESNIEQVLIASIQGLREMHSVFGTDIFTQKDKMYIEKIKEKGASKTVTDLVENLLNELEGRSIAKVSKDVEEHSGQIEKLEIGVAGTKVVLKKVHRDVKEQGKEIEGVKQGLGEVNTRVDEVEMDVADTKERVEEVDKKTMSNAPIWSRDVTKLLNPESEHDWRLLASRLGYSPDDIRGWATQSDPCMALLSEWYATHRTFEASRGVLTILQEMNRLDAAIIVENAMKAAEGVVTDEPVDYPEPPEIFLSYQWGHQNEVKLICRHLEMAGYKCWMDIGQMGGGDKLFEKIDSGIRAAKIVISCVTEKYAKSPNCNREVNLSVNLGKPMIPLLMEKMAWPPAGSMGPIFSEYLFIRFFQRPGEETNDDRIWPAAKFTELLMQMNCLKIMPDEENIATMYKNWWMPVVEEIVIPKRNEKKGENKAASSGQENRESQVVSPDVFISYQWGKQKEIIALFQRLTSLGFTCWLDIRQMGGGDSLYDKIDRGVRGCKVMLSSVTTKYALSANCRREVSLADALKKPIIPLLMEKIDWPPTGPMSMVLTQLLYVNFSKDESIQLSWEGKYFDELLSKIKQHVPTAKIEEIQTNSSKQEKNTKDEKSVTNGNDQKQRKQETEKPSYPEQEQPRVNESSTKNSANTVQNEDQQSQVDKKKSSTCSIL
ncbi:uncharacterized protein LOC128175814 [Crassostrea angulata]|uniref:uncharacterized protein LOC128175814 n=1 Tax=Magallana angulata TaxID=2784310 RepID=UPI0022B09047|nr:uncharacterized protein LOC128175814 [Crassostrea angulata]